MSNVFYTPNTPRLLYMTGFSSDSSTGLQCGASVLYTGVSVSLLALIASLALIPQLVGLLGAGREEVQRRGTKTTDRKELAITIILITVLFLVCALFPIHHLASSS